MIKIPEFVVPVDFIKTHNFKIEAKDEIEALDAMMLELKKNKKFYEFYNSYEIHNYKIKLVDEEGDEEFDSLSHLF